VPREHRFGGEWTEEKLTRLKEYLSAYTKIFTRNERASYLTTIYVDAFAGTGYRASTAHDSSYPSLFDEDAQEFQKGSTYIALENEPSFDRFLFIERRADFARELSGLREHFPEKASRIKILQEEANSALRRWALETDWRTHRAVVFLDPYGMEVEWATIEALARTEAVDLWILFPLGQAVNRLLTSQPPEGAWAERLTRFFGTDEWRDAFYRPSSQRNLFREQSPLERDAELEAIGEFFLQRLRSVFPGVSRKALALRNSRHVPIYLLCFAAANARGAQTAIKIADHILKK
jgi:three-Cys-motif partner protein